MNLTIFAMNNPLTMFSFRLLHHRFSNLTRVKQRISRSIKAIVHTLDRSPTILTLLAIISIQMGSALASQLFAILGVAGTAFVTTIFSAAMLSFIAPPRLASRNLRQFSSAATLGITFVVMELPFFLSLKYLPLGIASTIQFLGPLTVSLLTSREKSHWLSAALAIIGIALLMPAVQGNLAPVGLLLAGIAAVGLAIFAAANKKANAEFDGNTGLSAGIWIAAGLLLPIAFTESYMEHAHLNAMVSSIVLMVLLPNTIVSVLIVSFLVSACPATLEYCALRTLTVRAYGILMAMEPAVAVAIGAIFLHQQIGLRAWLAIICITAAAITVTLTRSPNDREQ